MLENAKWIWANCEYSVNQYADFLLEFELEEADENAILEISVDGEYTAYINDEFVGCGQYHDYPFEKSYDTLYVGKTLKKGRNQLKIGAYHQGTSSMQYAKGVEGLCFALKNFDDIFISDKNTLSAVNKKYTSGEMFKITPQLGYGYMYDATEADNEYKLSLEKVFDTNFISRPVKKLEISECIPTKIIAQGYFMRKCEEVLTPAQRMYADFLSHRKYEDIFDGDKTLPGSAVLKEMCYDGVYVVVDMGHEEGGYFTMDISVDEGALIEIGYGEHLEDMRVRTEIGINKFGRNFANSYIAKDGRNQFTYYFKRFTARYIQLHISNTNKLKIDYIGTKPARYPVETKGYFKCSDHLHNKIYDVCLNTLAQCMHEHYEDGPWREQALYASDSRNQILCGYYLYNDYDFIKSSLNLLGLGFGEDGYQNICAPTDDKLRIPAFTMFWLLEVAEYTEYTDDLYFIDKFWNKIEFLFEKQSENKFNPPVTEEYWNFYEWSDGYDNLMDNSIRIANPDFNDGIYKVLVCLGLKSVIYLAKRKGDADSIRKYTDMYESLKNDINKNFWDEEKKVYASYYYGGMKHHYGELMQVMAVYSGIAEDRSDSLCELIMNPQNELVKISLSYSLYKYEVLLNNGKYDKEVFDEIADKYGRMLYKGATSFWETEVGADDFYGAGSLCHGWSAFPVYLYYRYVLGITPSVLKGEIKPLSKSKVFASYEGKCGNLNICYRN